MKGIQYVISNQGKRKAVQIDLSVWGQLWEDFQDVAVSKSRETEPRVSWDLLKNSK